MHRVSICTDARNTQSRTAILRIGASFEGILRSHRGSYAAGEENIVARDSAMYSVIRSEWPVGQAGLGRQVAMTAVDASTPVMLVTGGSRGIGAAVCRLAAEQGYAVVVNYAATARTLRRRLPMTSATARSRFVPTSATRLQCWRCSQRSMTAVAASTCW